VLPLSVDSEQHFDAARLGGGLSGWPGRDLSGWQISGAMVLVSVRCRVSSACKINKDLVQSCLHRLKIEARFGEESVQRFALVRRTKAKGCPAAAGFLLETDQQRWGRGASIMLLRLHSGLWLALSHPNRGP